jgi:hypothetical protein
MAAMNLTPFGNTSLMFGTGNANILSRSIQKKFSSEVEVVDGNGVIVDIIYSGAEQTETTTEVGDNIANVGTGDINTGIITRSSVKYSNEDVIKTETEKISFSA